MNSNRELSNQIGLEQEISLRDYSRISIDRLLSFRCLNYICKYPMSPIRMTKLIRNVGMSPYTQSFLSTICFGAFLKT